MEMAVKGIEKIILIVNIYIWCRYITQYNSQCVWIHIYVWLHRLELTDGTELGDNRAHPSELP